MASSSSGHPPGQEVVGVVPEVGEQVVGVRQDGLAGQEAVVGPEAVGLGLFMVGATALMLVVALACLLASCVVAAGCSHCCNALCVLLFTTRLPARKMQLRWSGNSAGVQLSRHVAACAPH